MSSRIEAIRPINQHELKVMDSQVAEGAGVIGGGDDSVLDSPLGLRPSSTPGIGGLTGYQTPRMSSSGLWPTPSLSESGPRERNVFMGLQAVEGAGVFGGQDDSALDNGRR